MRPLAAVQMIKATRKGSVLRMKITDVEIFVVDGGRRPWLFSAVRTDAGITGYGEFGVGGAAGALVGLIEDFKPHVIGKDPEAIEKIYFDLYRLMRQAPGGLVSMGIAAIELACWDIKGKALGCIAASAYSYADYGMKWGSAHADGEAGFQLEFFKW